MQDCPILASLAPYTPEGKLTPGYGDHYLFFVGRDDVHGILHHLIPQEKQGLKFDMFGYDDEELNNDICSLLKNPAILVQATLDLSQEGGVHEKKIIALDMKNNPNFGNSFAIGQSLTHQISHTKGGVLLGQHIGFEGSTNWSASGEGIGVSLKADVKNPAGFKAQNNTLLVTTNGITITRFIARLDVEHNIARAQERARETATPRASKSSGRRRS